MQGRPIDSAIEDDGPYCTFLQRGNSYLAVSSALRFDSDHFDREASLR